MLAVDLITNELPTLTLEDNFQQVSSWMDEFKMTHLPVINEGKYMGLVSESVVFELNDWDEHLRDRPEILDIKSVQKDDHAFEAIKLFSEHKLSSLAVVDDQNRFVGSIALPHAMEVIGGLSFIQDIGGIIMLEINIQDYSMVEIAQIVESNDTRILGSYITANSDSKKTTVTLKLNKKDIGDVLQTFERYDYTVLGSFHVSEDETNIQDRYDNLMNFLNV